MVGDFGVGTWGQPVHDPRERQPEKREPEKLTDVEYFALFGRTNNDTRWLSSANSEEYLTLVTWLVQRNPKETR